MLVLIKVIEFLLVVMIFKRIILKLFSGQRKKTAVHDSFTKSERFDGAGKDISDAEYEEIR